MKMLRVVYQWRLQPENAAKFRAAWKKATTGIRVARRAHVVASCYKTAKIGPRL